ncbi:MAG: sensor histidine kinase N-terminal domain-containing protein [Candidatus Accumulibacter sp.]|uniref:ATP-binding protein n=1 Tax=Accumulibacter sp. TaxID=2053492 RepID=UPI001A46642F|nr:ATP-binding protein [Accumulibacter sp.]MBL8392606.1 sensor histidine kinase N-terminal domain-containing protein [Accumulibacter sp.]HRD89200.1 sensor histidine kinase N-terminal domain-containing protein [Accumulibacter sp.]
MPGSLQSVRLQSLRWRLLRTVCLASLCGLALTATMSYWQAQHEAEELMDGHLAQSARLLLALVRDNEAHLGDLATRLATVRSNEENLYEPPLEFQIGGGDGALLLRSEHAPPVDLSAPAGYTDIEHDGQPWRILSLVAGSGDYRVQVGQSIALRDRAALEVAVQSILPIALMSPLLLLLLYYSVRRGLKPLDDLTADVAARSPDNLMPLAGRRVPTEAQPLVVALNRLLFRLRATLDNERRFTADAAHELRTPLAVVRIHAQVAQLTADTADRQHALDQVLAGTDRATRVVEQLLRLARLDPLARLPTSSEINLAELAQRVLADTQVPANRPGPRLQTRGTPLSVSGDGELLEIALRTLLDNALRHTPDEARITVFVRREAGEVALAVADDGPGVAADELPRLAERFHRGSEAGGDGSGLGLAIAQRIAELHGARLEVENLAAGGFEARLRWPRPAASVLQRG